MAGEIVLILLLLVLNGIFAMSEIAVVTSRRVRLQQRAKGGDKRARAALALAESPTQFLSTVQVGITLVGIFAGAYGGARLAQPLAAYLERFELIAAHRESVALGVVVTAITYLSLIIGELVPKALALSAPETIASWVAKPLGGLARAATPLVRLLSASTHLVLSILRVKPRKEYHATEDEIRALIRQAMVAGEVAPVEQQIVEQVFLLGDRRVQSIMTPRHEIDWFDLDDGIERLKEHLVEEGHPRLLICDGSLDVVAGVLYAEELLVPLLDGRQIDLAKLLKPPLFVPATMSVFQLLESFRTSHIHIALVLDEFGAIEGLVTPTDILEGLVGEISNEPHAQPGPIYQRDESSWLVDGTTGIQDLVRELPLPPTPEDETGVYHTLAGFVMTRLARVPRTGDRFTWNGYSFEVVDMDGRRVDKVLVQRLAPPAASAQEGGAGVSATP